MTEHERYPFSFEGKDYEIRVLYNDTAVNVAAFHRGYPTNGFRHQILLPKDTDIQVILKKEAARDLVEMSKQDIREKRWDRISRIFETSARSE